MDAEETVLGVEGTETSSFGTARVYNNYNELGKIHI